MTQRAPNSGMFGHGNNKRYDNQGKRGKNKRTLMLEALFEEVRDENGDPMDNPEQAQAAYLRLLVRRSMVVADKASATLAKEVLDRLIPVDKATMPTYEIDFPAESSASDRIDAITKAVAEGRVPPDVGKMMVDMVSSAVKIGEIAEMTERLARLEEMLAALEGA